MAYATTNPPVLESQSPAGTRRTWSYSSTEAVGSVDATGYFTNGQDLGMSVGDKVIVYQESTSAPKMTDTHVSAVSSTGVTVVIVSS